MSAAIAALARLWAWLGGAALSLLVLITAYDVLAGKLFNQPLAGTYELAAMLSGISIFAFFPWAQISRAHVRVDLVMKHAGRRANAAVSILSSAGFLGLALFLTWRMALGGLDSWGYGEMTPILGIPIWWPVPLVLISLLLWAAAAAHCLAEDINTARHSG